MNNARRRCRFWITFIDSDIPMKEIPESYCVDRAEALAQARDIYGDFVADIVLFQFV